MLDNQIIALRSRISSTLTVLSGLAESTDNSALVQTISDLQQRLEEPFLFVIVGEVKAGKSSFINALLQAGFDLCKVAPSPMTDSIQLIVYGDEPREEILSLHLKKIYQPADALKEIAIVDTPGTNTIIEHHQEITETFVPGADLIAFVFEAKNPYRQSAWDFFDYIHESWHKKVIFILQQKDLLSQEDLLINEAGVREQAARKGLRDINLFSVSALEEKQGQSHSSGFGALRLYIQQHITGGQAPTLKLASNLVAAERIADRIADGYQLRHQQYEVDLAFREDISQTLKHQTQLAGRQVDLMIENLLAGYDASATSKSAELQQLLSFGSVVKRAIASVFSRESSLKQDLNVFRESLEKDLTSNLARKLNLRILQLGESVQQMLHLVDLKLRAGTTSLLHDNDLFGAMAAHRADTVTDLQRTLGDFLHDADNFRQDTLLPVDQRTTPALATGGGIAAVGVILSMITSGAVFDITGGVLTAVGILLSSVTVGFQRRKIVRHFRQELASGRSQLQEMIEGKLNSYIDTIQRRIEDQFTPFDALLSNERENLQQLSDRLEAVRTSIDQTKALLGDAGKSYRKKEDR